MMKSCGRDRPGVLITHRYFWPENLSLYPAMLKGVAEWHRAEGHDTTVFTSRAVNPDAHAKRHAWADEHGVRLVEVPVGVDRGAGAFKKLTNTLRYTGALHATLKREEFDLALVGTTPPLLPAVATRWALAGSTRKRYLYYVQDILPEMLASSGGRLKSWLGRALAWIDRESVSGADAVITLSEEMRTTLSRRSAEGSERVAVLPNHALEAPSQQAGNPEDRRPRLVFAGNQGAVQNLQHFLQAVAIANRQVDFEVELIGTGSAHGELRALVERLGLSNVLFTGEMPREEAQRRIESADIGVVAAAPGLYWVAYPSKINSYLLAGLSVLVFAEETTSIGPWLRAEGFGKTASPVDAAAAAESLVELVSEARKGRSGRAATAQRAAELLSAKNYLKKYERVVTPFLSDYEQSHELRERPIAV